MEDFVLHKKYVMESGLILIHYLMEQQKTTTALELLKRLSVHDNSKLESEEFNMLCLIPYNTTTFKNANISLDDNMKECISLHWKHNRHHPEHFESHSDMTELDIMEMCCDWHARSCQYHTDFLDFVYTRQETRFHFSDGIFEKILYYCNILNGTQKRD